jgi:hypothetical protein
MCWRRGIARFRDLENLEILTTMEMLMLRVCVANSLAVLLTTVCLLTDRPFMWYGVSTTKQHRNVIVHTVFPFQTEVCNEWISLNPCPVYATQGNCNDVGVVVAFDCVIPYYVVLAGGQPADKGYIVTSNGDKFDIVDCQARIGCFF